MHSNHVIVGILLGGLAVTLFGASLPATRLAVFAFDPWFVTFGRGAGAGLVAASVLAVLRRPIPWPDMPRLLAIVLCLVIGFPGLMAVAMTKVPSAHGGVILALLPITTAIAAALVAGERPSLLFWALAAAGAAIVVAFSLRGGAVIPQAGDLHLLAAVAVCGTGYALSGALSRRMPGWEVISWAVVASLPVLVPATLLTWPDDAAILPWPSWAGLLYVMLVSQYFGFFLWNSALALGGVARIGQLQLLQPFATLAIAALLLGEEIEPGMILFATAVVIVVGLSARAKVGSAAAGKADTAERRPLGSTRA